MLGGIKFLDWVSSRVSPIFMIPYNDTANKS